MPNWRCRRREIKRDVSLSPDEHRMAMVRIAVQGHPGIEASDVELALPRPNYTVDTLRHLRERWPDHRFDLIIGGDNLDGFMNWRSPEEILAHHDLLVYPRAGSRTAAEEARLTGHPRVHVMADAPAVNISATGIRRSIAAGKSVDGSVEPRVAEYIRRHGLYMD